MVVYLKGTLEYCLENRIIVEVNGIGYTVFVSAATIAILPPVGSVVKIFTHLSVKDDVVALYGFSSMEELELFHKLIMVSGVGPKGALGFLAIMKPNDIIMAILSADEKALAKAPGVGKKTAQRVILELRDKFKSEDMLSGGMPVGMDIASDAKLEAVEALASLGYSRTEAVSAVAKAFVKGMDTETIIKRALSGLSKF